MCVCDCKNSIAVLILFHLRGQRLDYNLPVLVHDHAGFAYEQYFGLGVIVEHELGRLIAIVLD